MVKLEISYEWVRSAMQSQGVRDGLEAKARQVAERARSIAASEGADMEIGVRSGTRPGGRTYSDVYTDKRGEKYEFGDSITRRLRILGRAAEGA